MNNSISSPPSVPVWRKWLIPFVTFMVLAFWFSGAFNRFENVLWDNFLSAQNYYLPLENNTKENSSDSESPSQLHSQTFSPPTSNILIVEIDSKSINSISHWPWKRNIYSDVLNKLAQGNAKSIFIDVDFSSKSNDPIADSNLDKTLQEISKSIPISLPAFLQNSSTKSKSLVIRTPIFKTGENIEAVSVNINPSLDGLVRKVTNGFRWENIRYRSAWNAISNSNIDSTLIDFSISTDSFSYISVVDLLNSSIEPDQFLGKDILIGSTAIELGDIVPVPVMQAVPGVVLHALAVETLNKGGLFLLSSPASLILLIIISILFASLFKRLHWATSILVAAAFFICLLPLHYYLYHEKHLVVPIFSIAFMIISIYFSNLILQLDENVFEKIVLQVALHSRNKLLDSIFSASNECILCVDKNGNIFSANPRSKDIFYCESHQLINRNINDFFTNKNIHDWSLKKKPYDSVISNTIGQEIPVEICISPIDSTKEKSFTFAIRSLQERKEKEAQLKYALEHDKITGLVNREKLFVLSKNIILTSGHCYLLKVDIDYFDELISNYGHNDGDTILQNLIEKIKKLSPENSILSRIGKNELVLLIHNSDDQKTNDLANTLAGNLNRPIAINNINIEIFCHIGISTANSNNIEIENLIRQSNTALKTARQKGLEYDWNNEKEENKLNRLSILSSIRQTLRRSEFDLAFQPKIDLSTGAFVSCEVLLRTPSSWNKAVNIETLIETAEKSSLIAPLTFWVFDKLSSLESIWEKQNLPKNIAINLSAGLIGNDNFLDELLKRLNNFNHYFNITLEVTETYFSDDWQHSLYNVARLRERGIDISVDDYGTGYSSLSYLKDLQATELKIDRSFITDIDTDKEKQLIVLSTIKMAHELGMTVVAEGIETHAEKEFLVDANCNIGQGYLFAKPMPFSQLQIFLPSREPQTVLKIHS